MYCNDNVDDIALYFYMQTKKKDTDCDYNNFMYRVSHAVTEVTS